MPVSYIGFSFYQKFSKLKKRIVFAFVSVASYRSVIMRWNSLMLNFHDVETDFFCENTALFSNHGLNWKLFTRGGLSYWGRVDNVTCIRIHIVKKSLTIWNKKKQPKVKYKKQLILINFFISILLFLNFYTLGFFHQTFLEKLTLEQVDSSGNSFFF